MIFTIIYNPYLQKTIFLKNGLNVESNNDLKRMANEKIQDWFKKTTDNQDFFEVLQNQFKNEQIELDFWGRICDFKELETYLYAADAHCIKIKEPTLIENEVIFIEEIFTFIKALETNKKISNPLSDTFKKFRSDMFKVCILATMSSGKSTLINAMLGRDLLPSSSGACTATITTMTDNDEMKNFDVCCFDVAGKCVVEKRSVCLEELERFNEDKNIKKINLVGPIPGITCSNFKLHLIDTPGPNNSTNDNHEELTIEVVESEDYAMVIYLMSPSTIQSDDNDKLFEIIENEMQKKGKNAQERFLFVLNKCDELDPEDEDDTIEAVIETAKKYLIAKGIEKPNIFPVTAKLAKLLRMQDMGHKITKKNCKEIKSWIDSFEEFQDKKINHQRLYFDQYASMPINSREAIDERLKQAKVNNDKRLQAMIHTGVPALEETIEEYLKKNVYPMKIMEFVEHVEKHLQSSILSNALEVYFLETLRQNKKKKELLKQIESIANKSNNFSEENTFEKNALETAFERLFSKEKMVNKILPSNSLMDLKEGENNQGVFELFAQKNIVIIQLTSSKGLIIINDDDCEINPIHLNKEKYWIMKENKKSVYGVEGIRYKFYKKQGANLGEKDLTKVIWMPRNLKLQIQKNLDYLMREKLLISNFSQIIGDETIAMDIKALLAFVKEQNHPIFQK